MGLVSGQLKKSGFEAACRSAFSISISAQPDKDAIGVELTLRELQSRTAPAGYEQYSLIFQGPLQPALPQAIYRFSHECLGEMDLFMVPIGSNAQGIQYEVCVLRLTENG